MGGPWFRPGNFSQTSVGPGGLPILRALSRTMIFGQKTRFHPQASTAEAPCSHRLAAAFGETGCNTAHRAGAADRLPDWRDGVYRAKRRHTRCRPECPVTTAGATPAERP